MYDSNSLLEKLKTTLGNNIEKGYIHNKMVSLDIAKSTLKTVCKVLRDDPQFSFAVLIDICGIDYQTYGFDEWVTQSATYTGFERAVESNQKSQPLAQSKKARFGIDYQLLSIEHNHRLRLRTFADLTEETMPSILPILDSVCEIWPSANWYEREIFDLYGLIFQGHPDLRRILTDYGFQGHPFRKDFPLIGEVEIRYDATKQSIVHEPVTSVKMRTLVPKVIRIPSDTYED